MLAGQRVKEFAGFAVEARRRLAILAAATRREDLAGFRSSRLETLKGNRAGQFGIRIDARWRISFRWDKEGAERVEIGDCH